VAAAYRIHLRRSAARKLLQRAHRTDELHLEHGRLIGRRLQEADEVVPANEAGGHEKVGPQAQGNGSIRCRKCKSQVANPWESLIALAIELGEEVRRVDRGSR